MDLESLMTGMNLTSAAAIFGIMHAIKAEAGAAKSQVMQRLMPVLPLVLGAVCGLAGGVVVDPVTVPNKIIGGLMVGGLTMILFKVGKTSLLGRDLDSPDDSPVDEAPMPRSCGGNCGDCRPAPAQINETVAPAALPTDATSKVG